jgi:peptide/nickel transport system substrate-binding protein
MKRGLSLLLTCTLLLAATACTKGGGSATDTGILRIALPISPTQLNPLLAENTNETFVDSLVFSQLVTIDDKGNEVPDLAAIVPTLKNGGISKDGKTITYHLRRNVKWHDGVAFTSEDVKFSWQAILNTSNNVLSRGPYMRISRVDTPDPYTVVFHYKQLFAPAVDTIFGESDSPYRIVPAHLLAKYPNINQVPFDSSPIGTGPFKFIRWLRGDRIVFAANPDYFLGRPKLDQIIVKIVTDDNTTQAQLRSHEVDLALEINSTTYHALADAPQIVRKLVPSPEWEGMLFNWTRAPFTDSVVRHAVVLATDSATIASKNEFGTARVATADLSPFYWAFDSSLKPAVYDPAQAARLLDADGWRVGAGGIRTKNGVRLSMQIAYGQGSVLARDIAIEMQQSLQKIGIDLQVKSYSYALLYAAAQDGGIFNSGKFDIAFYAWNAGADPDNSSQWMCDQVPPAGNNASRYCNAQMDAAQRLALSTPDRGARKRAYADIESLLLRDAPAVFFFYPNLHYAYSPSLRGFTPNGIDEGWNAYQWSI